MPTAIRTLELDDPPADLVGLTEYARALVLVRWRGEPVGQMMVHVTRGRVSAGELRERALAAAQSRLRERWVHDFLGWNEAASVPPTATVAVCTRDRTDDLRRCLDALRTLPDDGQEVLVVDNCPSSDATRDLVARYPGVRYVREERAGLDIARNRALHEARGDVVAFTDDDAAADPGWLRALLRNFGDPRTLCVTGLTMPLELETEAQEWFERTSSFGRGFWRATYDGTVHSTLAVARIGAGVNMAPAGARWRLLARSMKRSTPGRRRSRVGITRCSRVSWRPATRSSTSRRRWCGTAIAETGTRCERRSTDTGSGYTPS